ncbi:MAG TPA: TIGR00303 family protein [Drouetiella sp.]|jgi:uncharacterized protein (TIGR00303 family)
MDNFLRVVNDQARIKPLISQLNSSTGFYLCLGSTATSDMEGISAAGSTPQLRRLTPAADAEALVLGRTNSLKKLPVSPLGIVSPVVVTRACLQLAAVSPTVVNCGCFVAPDLECISVGDIPADAISTGHAMPLNTVQALFESGYELGLKESKRYETLLLAECVPGGTTTALGVLIALGYNAHRALSSSIPNCNHDIRLKLVEQGMRAAAIEPGLADSFEILAALGDPMQPFVAGIALAACTTKSVILAGGSQMLAVYALCKSLATSAAIKVKLDDAKIGVITTKWVAFDQHAGIVELSKQIGAPLAASCPDFRQSRHAGLKLYEDGNVKEGVGAGAAMALAYQVIAGDQGLLMSKIDQSYDSMVGDVCPSSSF